MTFFDQSRAARSAAKFVLEGRNLCGRLMQWQEFQQAEAHGTGSFIGEYLSTKGPFRLWWTPDDIPATTPHKWKREQHVAWMEPDTRIPSPVWLNWSPFPKKSEAN